MECRRFRARSTKLLHFLSSHPVDHICIQEFNLNSSSSFQIPGLSVLRSDRTQSRSGILSPDATHASGDVITFVRQGLSFSELSTFFLSLLDPYSDYVGSTSLLTTLPRSLFLMCTPLPLFASPQRMAEPTPFLPLFFPPRKISSFWETSTAITPSGTQKVPPTPAGRKYSTGSFLLTSSPSMTLTHQPLSIALLAVAALLTSPLLPPLLPFLVHGSSIRTWILTTNQLFYPSLSLRPISPTSVLLPPFFRKLAGMALPPTLILTVLCRGILVSFSFLCCCSLYLSGTECSQIFYSFRPQEAVSERCKAFAAAHRSDEDRQAYISPFLRASSVIAKAKSEAWQTTCSSLLPKSVHALLPSVAGSPSSSSSSLNFPICSSPWNRLRFMPLT